MTTVSHVGYPACVSDPEGVYLGAHKGEGSGGPYGSLEPPRSRVVALVDTFTKLPGARPRRIPPGNVPLGIEPKHLCVGLCYRPSALWHSGYSNPE